MGVLTFDGPDGAQLDLIDSNQGNVRLLNTAASAATTTAAFYGTYFVDPAFAGTETGSASNPFRTAAAAFAFAAALGITSGIVYFPLKTVTENIVLPTTGNWELAAQNGYGTYVANLTGTITMNSTAGSIRRQFTNLLISGAITGNAANGNNNQVRLVNCTTATTFTLTGTGTGRWRLTMGVEISQSGFSSPGGGANGAVNVTGDVFANNWAFAASTTCSGEMWLENCAGAGPFVSSAPGAQTWRWFKCGFNAGIAVTATTGPLTLLLDPVSASQPYWNSLVLTNVTLVTMNANASDNRLLTGNLAPQGLFGNYQPGMVVVEAAMNLIIPGTLGAALLQAVYTDIGGLPKTTTIAGPLNVAGAGGTEAVGVVPITRNGAGVAWQVTGITTPGPLQLNAAVNLRIAR